jgi:hypothetical protein
VADLVERFSRDCKVFLSPDYKEEQLRLEFGPGPTIRHSDFVIRTSPGVPVIHEESIKVAGATKTPDFRDIADSRRLTADGPGTG